MKAIVMTCDRYRPLTEHMIGQYERLWPDHSFVFQVPYQDLGGPKSNRIEYTQTPMDIPSSVLRLLDDVEDEEWVYWCPDDKYPIQLVIEKIKALMAEVLEASEISGLMFCRCRATLGNPALSLYPGERKTAAGEILLERRAWYQIWIHQFLRAKVLRYFFSSMPEDFADAKTMDTLKSDILKLADHRLFVTKKNFAVFGESTHGGQITRNCYASIRKTDIELPEHWQRPSRERITMGRL